MTSKIILFDGVCNFCNFWVKFAAKRDSNKQIKFASLQSEQGLSLLKLFNISIKDLSTVIFIDDGKVYMQSGAAFRICRYLDGGWKLASYLTFIPRPVRDGIYNFIAKNRYKWFGKTEACMLPTPEMKDRFL